MSRSLSVILIWRGITPKWAHDHIVRACDLFLVYFCDYLSCRLSMPSPTQLLRMGWNRQLATNQLPSLMSSLSAALLSKHDLRKDLAHHQLLAHHWHHIFWVTAEIVQFGHYLAFSQMLYIINVTVNPNQPKRPSLRRAEFCARAELWRAMAYPRDDFTSWEPSGHEVNLCFWCLQNPENSGVING